MQVVVLTVLEIHQVLHFFVRKAAWKLVPSTGWLVFVSIFNYFVPTWWKDDNTNNDDDDDDNNNNDNNNNNSKQVWVDAQQHLNRKDYYGLNFGHKHFFGGFSSTRC